MSRNDVHFLCTFCHGTDATVGDGFAPLGPPLLPSENRIGRGQQMTTHGRTSRLLDRIGQVGKFGENAFEIYKHNLNITS